MASDDRFYLLEFRNRPVLWGDIGSNLRIVGLVVGGGGAAATLLLPGTELPGTGVSGIRELTVEEWSDFIRRSDNPEILVGPSVNGGATLPKIFHRKLRYEISGAVQQKVWVADRFVCRYCGKKIGEVLMTIDHFIPLELGGLNEVGNYLTSCKKCNKDKGSQHPLEWMKAKGWNAQEAFDALVEYLKQRVVK